MIDLIEASSAPLVEIENAAGQFAQDSTGFSTVTYDRWFDQKHGKLRSKHEWVKLHIMVGTVTNVVTAVKVSDEADCPVLPELLQKTAQRFNVREVSGDKAYLSNKNLEAIHAPARCRSFRSKATAWAWPASRRTGADVGSLLAQERRLSRPLSPSEQRRDDDVDDQIEVRRGCAIETPTAQVNELLAKLLCHNLSCIVHAITEFGIDADFTKVAPTPLTLVQP